MSSESVKISPSSHKKHHHPHHPHQKDQEFENTAPEHNNMKPSKSVESQNVNYISVGMKRLIELTLPIINLLNSLTLPQRRIALGAVGIIFFWPFILLALNLPWMLFSSCAIYAFYFGTGKLYSDANEAVKDHLSVDVEAKSREIQLKFQQSQFPGKEALISSCLVVRDLAKSLYKSILLASMVALDYLVTSLLRLARSAKDLANETTEKNEREKN